MRGSGKYNKSNARKPRLKRYSAFQCLGPNFHTGAEYKRINRLYEHAREIFVLQKHLTNSHAGVSIQMFIHAT